MEDCISVIMALGIATPYTRFGARLGMTHLPGAYLLWLALILVSYCVLAQQVKGWFARRHGYY